MFFYVHEKVNNSPHLTACEKLSNSDRPWQSDSQTGSHRKQVNGLRIDKRASFISKSKSVNKPDGDGRSLREAVVIVSPSQSLVEHRAQESCISGGNCECETCQIREEL